MERFEQLVKALRCKELKGIACPDCYERECAANSGKGLYCRVPQLLDDAAAAIEALQAEVKFYKALADEWQSSAENKERLLGLYRAEQAKHFYSAMDDNGRIIATPCVCMSIPVFPDSSEIPNS